MITQPSGLHPALDAGLRETYLKRADVLLTLKRFDAARLDYARAELFKERQDDDRWRTPPSLNGIGVDLKTLDAQPKPVRAWVRPPENASHSDPQPIHYLIDCTRHTVQPGDRSGSFEPIPGSYDETVRDFFRAPFR
jgi:hypothetical protein